MTKLDGSLHDRRSVSSAALVPFLAALGAARRLFIQLAGSAAIEDPPESWELTVKNVDWGRWGRDDASGLPYTPRGGKDVPEGAFQALHEACGATETDDLFVIPKTVRKLGYWHRSQTVVTPMHVLAVGAKGVGLWVGSPHARVEQLIEYERLCAIELVSVLLYGRLRFIGETNALTVRFNTVANRDLDVLILRVRQRIANQAFEVPPHEGPDALRLPFKWDLIARSEFLSLGDEASLAIAFHQARSRTKREASRGCLLALTPVELAYLHEPYASLNPYGTDGTYLPRSRIEALRFDEGGLACVVGGRRVEITMPPPLVQAAHRWFELVTE